MTSISLESFRQNVDAHVQKVSDGETITITDANQPVALIHPAPATTSGKRPFGLATGEFRVPDDFNDELPEDILSSFEGA